MTGRPISRRELLGRGAALAGAVGLGALASACDGGGAGSTGPEAEPFDGTLRILAPGLDADGLIEAAARRDLPFGVQLEAIPPSALAERVRRPGSFDVLVGHAHEVDELWAAGGLVGLDRARIVRWAGVSDLYRFGVAERGSRSCTGGDGDAPSRRLYTAAAHEAREVIRWGDASGEVPGEPEPPAVTGAPGAFELDSLAYDGSVLAAGPEEVSWGELLNGGLRGRVALPAETRVGLQDAALAARAVGLVAVGDAGNPTRAEIDALVEVLLALKGRGHFRAFWSTFDEAVDLMAGGEVAVESAPWLAVSLLRSSGRPARYAAPPEGVRGRAGLLFVSRGVLGHPGRLQACYDLVNWWHAGVPGAILMRYGAYAAVQGPIRAYVSPDEWDYWIGGRPAASDLSTPFLERGIRRGSVRDGGSLGRRACRIAAWLSSFEEAEHADARWAEVVAA